MPVWLYHITPISNLATMVQAGTLLAKNRLQASEANYTSIAYEHIQNRRQLKALNESHPGYQHVKQGLDDWTHQKRNFDSALYWFEQYQKQS